MNITLFIVKKEIARFLNEISRHVGGYFLQEAAIVENLLDHTLKYCVIFQLLCILKNCCLKFY